MVDYQAVEKMQVPSLSMEGCLRLTLIVQDTGVKAALALQQEKDTALAKLLALVRIYLPNRDRPGTFMNSDQ